MKSFCLNLRKSQRERHSRPNPTRLMKCNLGTRTHKARGPQETPHCGADQVRRWEWRRSRLGPSCRTRCSAVLSKTVCACSSSKGCAQTAKRLDLQIQSYFSISQAKIGPQVNLAQPKFINDGKHPRFTQFCTLRTADCPIVHCKDPE